MILACKKNLVNKHKQVGLGQTHPSMEKFPLNPVYFYEGVPKLNPQDTMCYLRSKCKCKVLMPLKTLDTLKLPFSKMCRDSNFLLQFSR